MVVRISTDNGAALAHTQQNYDKHIRHCPHIILQFGNKCENKANKKASSHHRVVRMNAFKSIDDNVDAII